MTPLSTRTPIIIFADEWGGVGGTAGYVLMLAGELRRRGYRVGTLVHNTPEMAPMRERLTEMGSAVHLIPGGHHLQRFQGYRRIFRQYRGGVLALMMGYYTRGGGAIFAARTAGIGGVVRADLTPPEPPHRRRAMLELRAKDLLTDIVVVGAHDNIASFGRELRRDTSKMRVIHTGIVLSRFQPGSGREPFRDELGIPHDATVIGMTSRLSDERKGGRDFIAMAARVVAKRPETRFLIVGDGVLRGSLEDDARRAGVADRVVFAGWRADIPAALAAMDIYVMPSHFEGGPTSVLEAMAMALPCVATRVGMVPEVIDDGASGLIVPVGDPAALAAACDALLTDDARRISMGSAARATALADFSIETMTDRYLEAFAEAAGGRARD